MLPRLECNGAISAHFSLQTIVKKGESYKDSKVTVLDGKEDSVPAVAKSDIAVVQRVGSGTTSALQFTPKSTSETAPLEEGKVVGTLTYDDQDLIGQGYLTSEKPSFEMVSEKKVEKAFFLKVWWNQFIRFINEKL